MVTGSSGRRSGSEAGRLWSAVDRLLEGASPAGIVAHRLGPLEASRLRRLGRPVPADFLQHERAASLHAALAVPLLERIRAVCDGPLVLFKGLELARRYPPAGRPFRDLDLLTPDARTVQAALLAAGFREIGHPLPDDHHHRHPLVWPSVPILVEIHQRPYWPLQLRPIRADEIAEASVPSSTGVEGIRAPAPLHHALILAVHGWQHRPLRVLRDLLDVAVVSAEADAEELERTAAGLGIGRIWRTTRRAADALFAGGPRSLSLRTWARSLAELRPRGPREVDLETMISGFWWMSAPRALGHAALYADRRLRG